MQRDNEKIKEKQYMTEAKSLIHFDFQQTKTVVSQVDDALN